jgi:hypothetical protein
MTTLHTAAARLPRLPDRSTIPPGELEEFDHLVERIQVGFSAEPEIVGGQPYGTPHFSALAVSPGVGAALSRLGVEIMRLQDGIGTFTAADHEMIDLVLAFDSGYWSHIAGHTASALAAGIRIEAIEALRDRREDDLTGDEREQVEFIRAVRDGTMTDELWARWVKRLGSERGVVELTHFVCLLMYHHSFVWAVGAPVITPEAYTRMLDEYRDGTREIPERAHNAATLMDERGER